MHADYLQFHINLALQNSRSNSIDEDFKWAQAILRAESETIDFFGQEELVEDVKLEQSSFLISTPLPKRAHVLDNAPKKSPQAYTLHSQKNKEQSLDVALCEGQNPYLAPTRKQLLSVKQPLEVKQLLQMKTSLIL